MVVAAAVLAFALRPIPLTTSEPPSLALGFEQGKIGIPNDPVLIGELQAFEGRTMNPYLRYSAPAGLHDDIVMALAIGYGALDARRQYRARMVRKLDLHEDAVVRCCHPRSR